MNETKKFYAMQGMFSISSFTERKPSCDFVEREVVWNDTLESTKADSHDYAHWFYLNSQAKGLPRVDFGENRPSMKGDELREVLETLNQAGITELTLSHEWSNWQEEFRVFLRTGWKITDSIDLPTCHPGETHPALLLVHD